MSDAKKWREIRREIRRAKDAQQKVKLEADLKALEGRMTPKQLKSVKEEYDQDVL